VKFVGYNGLCPRVSQSGEVDLRGPVSNRALRYLRWALMKPATHACKHDLYRERYERIKRRHGRQRGAKVAQIGLSRQLATASWLMLTRSQSSLHGRGSSRGGRLRTAVSMPVISVNGAELYYQRRGRGPSLLLIMGASGDGGVFDAFADLLADEFAVVTYDRRGNGRSPRPPGWDSTSPEEQADDAAALLDAVGLAPAAVFGTSGGGLFALELLIRHPGAVRGGVLHEPVLFSLVDDLKAAREIVSELLSEPVPSGGPSAAFERFIRFAGGDANWERLSPALRQRMLSSARTWLEIEAGSGRFDTYLPDADALASITAPLMLVVSDDGLPFAAQATGRLAKRLGVEVTHSPGTHFAYVDHPSELAEAVRPFLRSVSG
jgi:pimeloyl-ACP methyl ester carboxylesterase